jgi:hypothetical protein
VTGLNLPVGTRRLEVGLATGQARAPRVTATVRTAQGMATSTRLGPTVIGQVARTDFTVPRLPAGVSSLPARVCLTSSSGTFALAVTPTVLGEGGLLETKGAGQLYRAATWYRPAVGARRSYLGELGTIADRATVLAPGFLKPWVIYLALFGVLPMVALLAVRLLASAVAGGVPARRLALWVFVIAALNGFTWAVVTPAFQAPDEVDHYAYTESLVELGHKPSPYSADNARWSTAESDALIATGMLTNHFLDDSRAADLPANARQYRRLLNSGFAARDDGGGYETTASYGPLYYYAVAPGYLLGGTTLSRLGGMRLMSALIGALAGVFALLAILELVPRRPWLAVLGGLAVALEPMFGFLSGAVNNDVGIAAGAAAVVYLLLRLIRRGLPPWLLVVFGVLLGALPWVKSSAYELWVAVVVGVALALWSHRERLRSAAPFGADRSALLGWIGAAAGLVVTYLLCRHLNTLITPPPPVAGAATAAASSSTAATTGPLKVIIDHPASFLAYLWEVFLPPVLGMHEHFPPGNPASAIFLRGGWASFGWNDTTFPEWVYNVIEYLMAIALLLGLRGLWQRRRTSVAWWPMVLLVILIPLIVFIGFEAAFYTSGTRSLIAEMGRYEFPALVSLAALGVGALLGLGRRFQVPAAAVVLALMLALGYASHALTLVQFFS